MMGKAAAREELKRLIREYDDGKITLPALEQSIDHVVSDVWEDGREHERDKYEDDDEVLFESEIDLEDFTDEEE